MHKEQNWLLLCSDVFGYRFIPKFEIPNVGVALCTPIRYDVMPIQSEHRVGPSENIEP